MKRRAYLKTGSLAALSTTALAGCLGGDDDESTDSDASILDWLPVPTALDEELEDYDAQSTAPSTVQEYADDLNGDVWQAYQNTWLDWNLADPAATDVDRLIVGTGDAGRGTDEVKNITINIVEHSLDEGMLIDNLEADGFESADSYAGYDVYQRNENTEFRAIGDGALLLAERDAGGRQVLEALIDAKRGEVDRYHQANPDDVGSVIDSINTDHNFEFDDHPEITETKGRQGTFSGSIARGFGNTLGSPEVDLKYVEVFVEGADIRQSAIDAYIDNAAIFDGTDDVDNRIEGNRLIFEWSVRIDELNSVQLG
jgi:hypothetical protein